VLRFGPIQYDKFNFDPPIRNDLKTSMERTINHFKFFTEGYDLFKSCVYSAVEAPKGEFGVLIMANDTCYPYRCRIRAPGFFHLQALDFMCRNKYLADLVTVVGTQDIVFGEVDR